MHNKNSSFNDFYKSLNILCVEDEPAILNIYENIFSSMFHKVYTATNGKEGLKVFKDAPIDIILTDQMMPHCTGLEMSKMIREQDATIPIILVTAFNDAGVLTEALHLHITSFLNKPFDKESLFSVFNLAVKSVIADRVMQKEQEFTIKNLKKSVDYSSYQEKLSFEKEKIITRNDVEGDAVLGKYRCEVHYEPLDILSGDSYVIRNLNESETLIFLVDGMGKGISASLSAMLSSASINYYVDNIYKKEKPFDMHHFLNYIFAFIQPVLLEEEVLSAHFLVYKKMQDVLEYALFSMPPFLCFSKNSELTRVKSNNPPLSKYGTNFQVDTLNLKDVHKILIHSDGLNENSVENGNSVYGEYLQEDFINSKDKGAFAKSVQKRVLKAEDDITYGHL